MEIALAEVSAMINLGFKRQSLKYGILSALISQAFTVCISTLSSPPLILSVSHHSPWLCHVFDVALEFSCNNDTGEWASNGRSSFTAVAHTLPAYILVLRNLFLRTLVIYIPSKPFLKVLVLKQEFKQLINRYEKWGRNQNVLAIKQYPHFNSEKVKEVLAETVDKCTHIYKYTDLHPVCVFYYCLYRHAIIVIIINIMNTAIWLLFQNYWHTYFVALETWPYLSFNNFSSIPGTPTSF